MKKIVSNCCQADWKICAADEGTSSYECLKCKKACDLMKDKKNKQHRRPSTLSWIIAVLFGITYGVLMTGIFPHFGWANLILTGLLVFIVVFVLLSKWFRL